MDIKSTTSNELGLNVYDTDTITFVWFPELILICNFVLLPFWFMLNILMCLVWFRSFVSGKESKGNIKRKWFNFEYDFHWQSYSPFSQNWCTTTWGTRPGSWHTIQKRWIQNQEKSFSLDFSHSEMDGSLNHSFYESL